MDGRALSLYARLTPADGVWTTRHPRKSQTLTRKLTVGRTRTLPACDSIEWSTFPFTQPDRRSFVHCVAAATNISGGGVASGDVASAAAVVLLPSLPSSVSSASSSLSLSSERCFTLRLPRHVISFIFSFIFETVLSKGNAWVGFHEKDLGACLELLPPSPPLAHSQFSISAHLDSVWVLLRANSAALDEPTSHWRTRVATTQRHLVREMVLGLGQTATLFFGGDGDEGGGDHGDGGDSVVNGDGGRRGGARVGVSLESIDVCDFVPLGARPIARSHLAKLLEAELSLPRKEEAGGGDDISGGGGRSDGGSSSCCGGSGRDSVRTDGSTRTNGGVVRSVWNDGSAPEEMKHARGDPFVRTHLVEPIQRALQREVVAAEYHVDLLRRVYEELRVGHRGMYMAILNGVRAEPQYGAFERRATALSAAAALRRVVVGGSGGNGGSSGTAEIGGSGVGGVGSSSGVGSTVVRQTRTAIRQRQTSIQGLYTEARAVLPVFHSFLAALASKTSAVLQVAPLKRPFRSLEKAAVRKGDGSGDGSGGGGGGQRDECGNVDCVLDVVRGQLVFHDLNMMLACLELLASATSDPVGRRDARRRGWDARAAGIDQAIEIHRVKNRFASPTSGGWADVLVSFSFDDEDDDEDEGGGGHICELQLVHSQMMTVRSEMGGHSEYNQFRSALELLEVAGHDVDGEGGKEEEEEGGVGGGGGGGGDSAKEGEGKERGDHGDHGDHEKRIARLEAELLRHSGMISDLLAENARLRGGVAENDCNT